MCKSKEELSKVDRDSNYVFKRNNLNWCKNIPDSTISNVKYVDIYLMCCVLCACYSKVSINDVDNSQPVILRHDIENKINEAPYLRVIPTLGSNEKMIRCKYSTTHMVFGPRCTSKFATISGIWKHFKNDDKNFLFHLKRSFRSHILIKKIRSISKFILSQSE